MRGRTHTPDSCPTCVELVHLAAFGLPMWHICQRLGKQPSAVAKHVRTHPALAARLSPTAVDELRAIDSAERKQRSARRQETAA